MAVKVRSANLDSKLSGGENKMLTAVKTLINVQRAGFLDAFRQFCIRIQSEGYTPNPQMFMDLYPETVKVFGFTVEELSARIPEGEGEQESEPSFIPELPKEEVESGIDASPTDMPEPKPEDATVNGQLNLL